MPIEISNIKFLSKNIIEWIDAINILIFYGRGRIFRKKNSYNLIDGRIFIFQYRIVNYFK